MVFSTKPTEASFCYSSTEEKNMSVLNYNGTLYLCIRCMVCKDDISAFAHGPARDETRMCNCNK